MARNMSEETKNNILNAARLEFLEKGFEKTRMEDIAARAGVTKMMLYYYYSGKENILKELVRNLIEGAKAKFEGIFDLMDHLKKTKPQDILDKIIALVENNISIIKLVVVEVLKGTLDDIEIFDSLKSFYDSVIEVINGGPLKIKDKEAFYTRIFFFQSMPLVMNFMLADRFCSEYGISKDKHNKIFTQKFIATFRDTIMESSRDKKPKQEK